ncbi:hypothetical protein [Microcystis aeruginosa]|uniref:Uncharacterized protein n=1 Tax=Microcystis aeruginosa NIES-2521 TaxID=2303983 RepID=A0A5A5RZM1_MICAE|nr:hypothetical protein [Microcystis aeruginosa]GCA82004.1 hypothetical protein MiTs_04026 [Microcystis aeruginosa NIES-2521]
MDVRYHTRSRFSPEVSSFTWVNPKQNPLSPQLIPPKSSPVSRIPPKLPPVPKAGLGLGKMAARLRGGLPGTALMVGLTLLEWWLDQPAPPPPNSQPLPPGTVPGDYALNPSKTYLVRVCGKSKKQKLSKISPNLR